MGFRVEKFEVTSREVLALHTCLSSKLCIRIFKILANHKRLNISAIARKARCTNNEGIKHLRSMAALGIVNEEFYPGLHIFTFQEGSFTELMRQTIKIMEQVEETSGNACKKPKRGLEAMEGMLKWERT